MLTSFVTSANFTRHEFNEYVAPLITADTAAVTHDPATRAVDAAHDLAFRSGLGSSLFAPEHNSVTVNDVKSFAASVFNKGNIAIVGTGIDQATLSELVQKAFAMARAASTTSTPASKYFGGETRLTGNGGPQTVFIGFGTPGPSSPELATLAAHLSPIPSVKWSKGISPLTAVPEGTSVTPVHLTYSDATLFGLLVQGSTVEGVKEAGKVAISALKAAAQGIKAETLTSAKAKAKFAAASAVDTREGLVAALGSKVCTQEGLSDLFILTSYPPLQIFSDKVTSLDATLSSLDSVNATAFSKVSFFLKLFVNRYSCIPPYRPLPLSSRPSQHMSLLEKRICHSLTSWACKHIENPNVEEVVIRPYTFPTMHHFYFMDIFSEAPTRHPVKVIFHRRRFDIIDSTGSL